MRLRWYGTAAVMLESKGCKLVFDPFLGMPLKEDEAQRAKRIAAFHSADYVFVTHGHFDHIHDIPELYADSDKTIYASKTPCETLKEHGVGEDKLRLIAPGDSLTVGAFKIRVLQGKHCKFDFGVVRKTVFKSDTALHQKRLAKLWLLNKKYPENGETLFFELEAEGKRIQLMGSMGMDMNTAYPVFADVLILPFQGTGDPASTVRPIVEKLLPQTIYLDHYDDAFPPLSSLVPTAGFVRDMTGKGVPTVALRQGRVYQI